MRITELGDCSMVIMKDSEDPPWITVGSVYRDAERYNSNIIVCKPSDTDPIIQIHQVSSDAVYTAGRLILFFKDSVNPEFHLHDRVEVVRQLKTRKQY